MFPSIDDLRQKFQEAKYIADEVTLSQVYVAGELEEAGSDQRAARLWQDRACEGAGVCP